MTLLRLYRKHPDVIPSAEWALRIVSIMDDSNLVRLHSCELFAALLIRYSQGVALAVTSLVMTLCQDNLEAYAVCYQKAVDRLAKVRCPSLSFLVYSAYPVNRLYSSKTTRQITSITKFRFPGCKSSCSDCSSIIHRPVRHSFSADEYC